MALPTTPASLLPIVLQAMSRTPDARLRQLLGSLTTHLHQFVIDNQVSEAEFERAIGFIVGIGQATGPKKNEVILASDLLGVSTLVTLLNNSAGGALAESDAALLGPFWRANAPRCAPGENIARGGTPGLTLEVTGTVFDAQGAPLAGALVDVWQASPVGLYENQDPAQENMNLRGVFTTDAAGRYALRTVLPMGYPVPTDGPCGELLAAQQRQPMRPAHLHFMVSGAGHKVLITQWFPQGTPHIDEDPVFGVTAALVAATERGTESATVEGQPLERLTRDFRLLAGATVFPHPPIP